MDIKKRVLFIILIMGLIPIIHANDITSYNYIKLEITNDISFQINKESKINVEWFHLNSYFFPNSYPGAQHLNSFQTSNQNYKINNDTGTYYLTYDYNLASLLPKNTINNKFIVESTVYRPQISQKVIYPIKEIPKEYEQYLEFNEFIDLDNNIKNQASSLAEGEDDIYIISSNVAKWIIEDINYNLTTVFANPNQKSTEVFQSKSGVCREITNLYISMMRSLGIPARVVTGYAYTESEELTDYLGTNWGGHAWAEVLIGDKWVPFDLTYNQYGFVDASHIITDKYKQIRSTSAAINASGYGFNLISNSLLSSTQFKIIDTKESTFDSGFEIDIDGIKELGFGSYGYIKVKAKNTESIYQILFLKLAKTTEVELLDSNEKMLIFSPQEEKEIYFRFKLPEDLLEKYIYTFPFTVYNEYLSETFEVKSQADFFRIKKIALPQEEKEEKNLSSNKLDIDCNFILEFPQNTILCSVHNPNNYEISSLSLCTSEKCKTTSLKLNEITSISFKTDKFSENISYLYIKEQGQIELKLDKPQIEVPTFKTEDKLLNLNYTIQNYASDLTIHFILNNETINITPAPQKSNLQYTLKQEGNYTIDLILKLHNKTLDTFSKQFIIEPENTKEKITSEIINKPKSFLEKIIQFILSLF